MNALTEQFFNLGVMADAFPYLVRGLVVTVLITLVLAPMGIASGLALALGSNQQRGGFRLLVRAWVNVFRAMPPLVLIILAFTGLPFVGLQLSAFSCVLIGLLLNNSAYYCEILRAGLDSVPRGQAEAARATGMSRYDTLRHVVLPQAVRNVLPDLVSNTIEVMKSTSLAAVVSVVELLHAAGTARSVTFNTSPLTLAAVMYLIILMPAVRMASRLEKGPGRPSAARREPVADAPPRGENIPVEVHEAARTRTYSDPAARTLARS